jgi:hypothetical protein
MRSAGTAKKLGASPLVRVSSASGSRTTRTAEQLAADLATVP